MSKKSIKYMIFISQNITDNLTIMRGLVYKFLFILCLIFSINNNCLAIEKIGIITDTLLTPVNYYNAYFKTPEFFAVDIRDELQKRGMNVVPIYNTKTALKNSGLRQYDLEALQSMQQGYNLNFELLKKIAKNIGVNKLIVVTMGMDVQRDFLKNTAWNVMNISGMDVVNPTHRVSVYVGYVDVNNQSILWETIYAKNIRNNKMKNLDTAVANNYEGMLRLKEYSKYISPDIAYNVRMKTLNPNFVEPATYITKENVKRYAKDKHNIGSKKELSEIDRKKWDTEKLKNDTKENIVEFSKDTKENVIKASKATKKGLIKASNATKSGVKKANKATKSGYSKLKNKFFNKKNNKCEQL